jgi:hypothetical protein
MLLLGADPAVGQLTWGDLVVTAGASAEGYQGNLSAVSVPVTDSTEFASAVVGEIALRTDATYRTAGGGAFFASFDGGLRQLSARGFELRDYAPREWVGTLDARYSRALGSRAGVAVRARLRGRDVEDRPPMPLFLQPGYRAIEGGVGGVVEGPRTVLYDLELSASRSDFFAPTFAPQVRLLDHDALRFEMGATLSGGASATLRLFAAAEGTRYPKQSTFAPADPFRRDRTFYGGATWTHQGEFLVEVGLDGRANRSNSNRPEYDAFTLRGLFSASLPGEVAFSLYGAVTGKQYLHPSDFARLLPGEEANNASLAYVSFTRLIARNLQGTLRAGWTRAETEIGNAYFQRFGASFLMQFRPGL